MLATTATDFAPALGAAGLKPAANSLFRNILPASPCVSIFCADPRDPIAATQRKQIF